MMMSPKSSADGPEEGFGILEEFDRNGTLLSEERRMDLAKTRGLCYPCARITHKKEGRFRRLTPLTTDHVHNGICIKCYPEKVPQDVLAAWKKRHKPDRASPSPATAAARSSMRRSARSSRREARSGADADLRRHRKTVSERNIDRPKGRGSGDMMPRRRGSDSVLPGDAAAAAAGLNSSLSSVKKSSASSSSRRHKTDMDHSERSIQFQEDQRTQRKKAQDLNNSGQSWGQSSRGSHKGDFLGEDSERSMSSSQIYDEPISPLHGSSRQSLTFSPLPGSSKHSVKSDLHGSHQSLRSKRSSTRKELMVGDDSERSLSSNKFLEDAKLTIDLNASGHSLNRSRQSIVDDWQADKLGLSSAEIAEILEANVDDAATVRRTLHELRNEYNKEGLRALIIPMKAVLENHEKDPRILDVACGALWRMTADDVKAKRHVMESGSVNLVLDALTKHRDDYELAEWTLGAVASVASEPEYKERLSDRNAIEAILQTLKHHQDKPIVFEWACRVLYTLVTSHQDDEEEEQESAKSRGITSRNLALLEESGGIPIIIESMRANVSEPAAEVVAMDLLWRLIGAPSASSSSRILRKYVDAGLVSLLVHLLRIPSTSTDLYERVAELLSLALSNDKESGSWIDQVVGSVPSIIRRIREGYQNERILKASFRIFAAIAILGDVTLSALEDTTAAATVVDALKLLPADSESTMSGLLILWKLSSYAASLLDRNMVVSCLDFIKAATGAEALTILDYKAAWGFLVNTRETSGLHLSNFPVQLLLDTRFDLESDEEKARSIALESLPLMCLRFPEFGNDAVKYMMDEELSPNIAEWSSDRIYRFCRVVVAVGSRAPLDLPEHVSAGIERLVRETKDPVVLKVCLDFITCTAESTGAESSVSPSASRLLLDLFDSHKVQDDHGLLATILNALAHAQVPAGDKAENVVEAVLDFALSPNIGIGEKGVASTVVWSLLAKYPCKDFDILSKAYAYSVQVFERFAGESAEPFDSSLVEPACGILCMVAILAQSVPIEISQAQMDEMLAMIYMSMELGGSDSVPFLILEALYHFSVVYEELLIKCGVIVVVADTMQRYGSSSRLLDTCFSLLAQLASSDDVQVHLSIAYSDGIESLARGMESFPDHIGIQTGGCRAFSHLSIEGETRNNICDHGGTVLVVSALRRHEDDQALVEYGSSALLNITTDMPETEVVQYGILVVVVSLLQKYWRIPSIQQNCVGTLQNVAMKGALGKGAIAKSGGLEAIFQCLESHSDKPVIVERAFTTLWSLAVLSENRLRILNSRGVNAAVDNMLSLIEYEGVQAQACGFLCTLALEKTAKQVIEGAKACDTILSAMRVHYPSLRVQCEAIRALSVIYEDSDVDGSLQPSKGEIGAVLLAMRRFPHEEELQVRSCAALLSMLLFSSFGSFADEISDATSQASHFPSCSVIVAQIKSLASNQTRSGQIKDDKASKPGRLGAKTASVSPQVPAECSFCMTECGADGQKCSGSSEQHSLCRDCAQLYVGTALDPEGCFYHVQYKGGASDSDACSAMFQIPCPAFLDTTAPCDCAALEASDIIRILKSREDLSQKCDIYMKSQAESVLTPPTPRKGPIDEDRKPAASLSEPTPAAKEARGPGPNPSTGDATLGAVVIVGSWDGGPQKIVRTRSGFVIDRRRGLIASARQNRVQGSTNDGLPQETFLIGVMGGTDSTIPPSRHRPAVFRYVANIVATDPGSTDGTSKDGACILKITGRLENDIDVEGDGQGREDEIAKVALINPSSLKKEGLLSLRLTDEVSVDDQVQLWGYCLDDTSDISKGAQVSVHGFVCERSSGGIGTRDQLVVICPATKDLSGGPCLNQHGDVVGMLSHSDGDPNERWYVSPISSWSNLVRVARDTRVTERLPNDGNGSNGEESWVLVNESEESKQTSLPALHSACRQGASVEVIGGLVESSPGSVRDPSYEGMLPIHYLCLGGCFGTTQWMLQEEPTLVKQKTNDGDLPLHLLCKNPRVTLGVVEFVLGLYPEARNVQNNVGLLPEDVAGEVDHEISSFLSRGARKSQPNSAKRWHDATVEEVESILKENPGEARIPDDEQCLPIHVACQSGASLEVIQCLVEDWPESLKWTNKGGSLPLHTACSNRASVNIVKYLVEAWPDALEVANNFGWLPLHCACAYGASAQVTKLLLNQYKEACTESTYKEGDYPLHLACWSAASVDTIECLIEANEEVVKLENAAGELPLHKACFSGGPLGVIKSLVEIYPESLGAQDCHGCTPCDVASRWDSEESKRIVDFLSERESPELSG